MHNNHKLGLACALGVAAALLYWLLPPALAMGSQGGGPWLAPLPQIQTWVPLLSCGEREGRLAHLSCLLARNQWVADGGMANTVLCCLLALTQADGMRRLPCS